LGISCFIVEGAIDGRRFVTLVDKRLSVAKPVLIAQHHRSAAVQSRQGI
jgi:hypothetical protein